MALPRIRTGLVIAVIEKKIVVVAGAGMQTPTKAT
jgi:hypothetical protein